MGEEPRFELCRLTVSNLYLLYYLLSLRENPPLLQLFLRKTFVFFLFQPRMARLGQAACRRLRRIYADHRGTGLPREGLCGQEI